MLTDRQTEIMLTKLKRLETTLEGLLFDKVDEVPMQAFPTDGRYHEVPEAMNFKPCKSGDSWEGEGSYCWFLGDYIVPNELDDKSLYIYPKIEAYEGLLWVDRKPYGNFGTKIQAYGHGNHYCNMLKSKAHENECIEIALEYYAHHYVIGTQPFEKNHNENYRITYHSVDICVRNESVWEVYYNLLIVNQMVEGMSKDSFRRAELVNTLEQIHNIAFYDYDNVDHDTFYEVLEAANLLLQKVLVSKNSGSAPYAGLIGHSHMDTAWLWDMKETIKKCARTYSNQINLMDQYPDYKFMQSSVYHAVLMKENYPDLFEAMKKQIAAGRYEPNGAVYIECDCNIPSGEAMIRQFLWGQRLTREYFDYTSDTFWLPDTFGYSASLPQIMKGCKVKYFLTTKLNWGDTTEFPYDTFCWKGIDGSEVFVHFNKTHTGPEPINMLKHVLGDGKDSIKDKRVSNMRLLSYGEGDGGGGPTFEMIEIANRLADVEGLPKSSHITVSEFMNQLERTSVKASTYSGELYLELHRGTLTNQHTIKKNNRLAEIALRDLEYIKVRDAVNRNVVASGEDIQPLMRDLLVNQFHDILPGTCVPSAHDQSISETDNIIKTAGSMIRTILQPMPEQYKVSVINTLSFERQDVIYLDYLEGFVVKGNYKQQIITDLNGMRKLAVSGITIPAFASVVLELVPGHPGDNTEFSLEGNILETPFAKVVFDEKGYIRSMIDKRVRRELRGAGYPLNTFLIAEDVPSDWDNWDLDADISDKFRDDALLLSRKVISIGEVECRIRSEYQLSAKSNLIQDIIFYTDSAEVRFDTVMDWKDNHRFLKTAFDTSIHSEFARHEIQFGYLMRPTNRNTAVEKAKFEVSNHKYTDLSENRFGVAILNDCKYGISAQDSKLRLSLHKGGCRPDYRGDQGIHSCCYSFYPHNTGFMAESVVKPAYLLNHKPIIISGEYREQSLAEINASNIIIETVKPLEDKERAFILRMYEAEGTYTNATLRLPKWVKGITETNMLEEAEEVLPLAQEVELTFGAFEIKTVKINY